MELRWGSNFTVESLICQSMCFIGSAAFALDFPFNQI